MPDGPDFFDQRREWSRWKHEILRRYLPKFAGILGSRHRRIFYVDAFAGAGTYSKDDVPVPGSPLIAASLGAAIVQANAESNKWPYELHCINIEPDSHHFLELCAATSSYPQSIIQNLHGTFYERLSTILSAVGSHPTLFFLDPFGYKGMEWDTISALAARADTAKTELLINFQATKADRDAGWLDSYNQPARISFVQSLNDLMGTDAWQRIYEADLPSGERHEQLTALYASSLANLFHGIVARYPVRTMTGQLKYYVLHVTSHRRGCREMSDVIFRVEREYLGERERAQFDRGRQLTFDEMLAPPLSPQETEVQLISRLAEDIYVLGKQHRRITFGAIQDELAISWFGMVIARHFREACKLLIRQRRIDRERESGIEDPTVLTFL